MIFTAGVLGLLVGMFLMYGWMRFAGTSSDSPGTIRVRCYGCGRMYVTSHSNFRTSNYCMECA